VQLRYGRGAMTEAPFRIRVLVAEDDAGVAANLVRGLRAASFDVDLATDGVEAVRQALRAQHDILVLDLLLPRQTGFVVLEQLQGKITMPVIVLTARTELDDRLQCFDLGAADFMAKPFWIEELIARIRSRLHTKVDAPKRIVYWADAKVDLAGRTVRVGDTALELTRNEFDILAYLIGRPDRAISRQQLADSALDPLAQRDARTVDTHMARLRKKLGVPAGNHLQTVWGIGYRFTRDQET